MTGDALGWYQWMHNNHLISTWKEFTRAMELRFGPFAYENHQQALFKLQQTATVLEYQHDFERLCNRVTGLPHHSILDCFIFGLRPEIQNELAILQPVTISQAIGLAKLVESKLLASKPSFTYSPRPTQPKSILPLLPNPPPQPRLIQHPSQPLLALPAPPSPKPTTPQIRLLSKTEMDDHRAKGLCFNCDERYHRGHRCKNKGMLLLLSPSDPPDPHSDHISDDVPPLTNSETTPPTPSAFLLHSETPPTYTNPEQFHLSLQAVSGQPSPRTLRFYARINGHYVSVLVDTGSSHNIIQPRVATLLRLPTQNLPSFAVMVGNGAHLKCDGLCTDVPLTVVEHCFVVSLYVLPIQGVDIVLGVQWLQTLGPFVFDYIIPSMQFYHNGVLVTLHGTTSPSLSLATLPQLNRMIHTESVATIHTITMLLADSLPPPSTPQTHSLSRDEQPTLDSFHPDITQLLHRYSPIFSIPHGLPPNRPHDHHIHLKPHSNPINIKPYRYPHFQKEAMTSMIADMLQQGIIRPSTSPYSSPILLVKKKDGSWRFCVDYRALNAITIRDRFPIPTIDELLDELQGAQFFSKIDLRSGYHQIRLAQEDIPKTGFRTFDGHYEFLVMPFGLTIAPSTFQAAMNDLLRPFLCKFVLVFFDDILIYSPTWSAHLTHLQQVLQLLLDNHFYAKLSKCNFGVCSVDYLGHIISGNGVQADLTKVQDILAWPTPKSLTALRAFLGLTGFYRRFVQHYATIAGPLQIYLKLQH
ncbi:uncharacterized protein LOC114391685 [Glycine soja]|uniref:uncharacterized protein LOC114391685 n=1 Tax=Glycine soja TaxID=3848 RepID=UPI00103FBC84|nr:uncharacterized protein LOC114391685 [Glycine soja]